MAEEQNPYEPPRAELSLAADAPTVFDDASAGARLANVLIDYAARWLIMFGVGVVLTLVGISLETGAVSYLVAYGSILVYYVLLETLTGRTIGKLITGTRVVRERGGDPTFGQILGRTLSRFVPFEPFTFLGSRTRGLHDRWSGTRVVKIRR